jgi:CBS domain-containing protein
MSLTVEDAMSNPVITIKRDFSAKQAANLMELKRVSGLVVINEKMIEGIITEADIVTRVVARGNDPDKVRVGDVMSQPVITIRFDAPLEYAVMVMMSNGIKKLPVLSNKDKVIGILSLTDVAILYPAIYATMKQLLERQNDSSQRTPLLYIS